MSKLKKISPIAKTDNESLPTQEEYKRKSEKSSEELDRYFIDVLIDENMGSNPRTQEGNWVEDYFSSEDEEWEETMDGEESKQDSKEEAEDSPLDEYDTAIIDLARTAMLMRFRTLSKEQEEAIQREKISKNKAGNDR